MSDTCSTERGFRCCCARSFERFSAIRRCSGLLRAPLALALCGSLLLPGSVGCSGLTSLSSASFLADRLPGFGRDKESAPDEDNEFADRIDTPLLSEYISVQGNSHVVLRGVGLVTGLDGTGDDPPPSTYRTQLQNEMTRRNVPNPSRILASPDTALVLVTALLPPMVREEQRFDVRVVLPPNSKATSLRGGWLLPTRLFEEQVVAGRGALKGHEYATAGGAILLALGTDDDRTQRRSLLMRGTIPGGAVSKTERDLSVVLRTERRGFRNSQRIASTIAERFYHYNKFGQRKALASAKTDALIELKVHPTYRNNFPRYQRVIRSLAFHESPVARRLRIESLAEDLLQPATAHRSALQLEAIGDDGIPFLRRALEVDNLEVRFEAAQALAYLGDASGIEVLREAAKSEPAFRVYALAAMSVLDDADSVISLRELMSHESLETRYGAFTALRELEPYDPSIPSISFDGGFKVYTVDSQGEPMVHVKRYRAPEVVLFGVDQVLRPPIILNAGRHISIIGQAGSHEVAVHRYRLGQEPETTIVSSRLLDVIRAAGEFGATYPDIVQMLIEAERQHNLSGDFGIDRLPQSGRTYARPADEVGNDSVGSERRIGSAALVPNLFDRLEDDEHDPYQDTNEDPEAADPEATDRTDAASGDAPAARDIDPDGADPLEDADRTDGRDPDRSPQRPDVPPELDRRASEAAGSEPEQDSAADTTVPDFALSEPGSAGGASDDAGDSGGAGRTAESEFSKPSGPLSRVKDFFQRRSTARR